jgi:hypothetical protein
MPENKDCPPDINMLMQSMGRLLFSFLNIGKTFQVVDE